MHSTLRPIAQLSRCTQRKIRLLLVALPVSLLVLAAARPALATCAVRDFGAMGDGVTDDRAAIQSAIDTCSAHGDSDVYIANGTYSVTRAGSAYACLSVPTGIHLRGESRTATTLREAPSIAASVRLLAISGDDVRLSDLTLDGNKALQSIDEHRAGIFVSNSQRLVVEHVTSTNFTGDGFYLYMGANQSSFVDVLATANGRNGITLGGAIDGVSIVDSRFIGNRAQQVDSEPGGTAVVRNVAISGSTLDGAGVSNDYVLTCSGTGRATRGANWRVVGNTLNGGVNVVWTDQVLIAGNVGLNPTTKACVTVYRTSSDVSVVGNFCEMTQTTVANLAGVLVQGTGAGSTPSRVRVASNDILVHHPQSFGVRAEGASSVEIVGNALRGGGVAAPYSAGVYVRATIADEDFLSAIVRGNTISNFGAVGISVAGNGAAKLLSLDVSRNIMTDTSTTPSMTAGVSLDDGTGAAKDITMMGNEISGGVTTPVARYPVATPILIGGTRSAGAFWSVVGAPEGRLEAPVGSLAVRRDGGALYLKVSGGTSNVGWVAK